MKFLSEEWALALRDKVNASEDFRAAAGSQQARIQQVVTDAPGGKDIRYWLTLENGRVDVGVGDLDDAEVTITQDYATAVALAKGDLSGVAAFMSGKIQVSNMMKVMGLQGALQHLAPLIREIDCEYEEPA